MRGEVHHHVCLRVCFGSLGYGLEHREDDLLGSPEGLVNARAVGVDDGRNAWAISLADVVEVQHPLDSIGLVAVNEGLGAPIEEHILIFYGDGFGIGCCSRCHRHSPPPRARGTIRVMWVSGPYTSIGTPSISPSSRMSLRPTS
ncbi:Uncharacterised protein [uncultured archaeon]|nr:Uncharacterised protein [uncultured archaeon]